MKYEDTVILIKHIDVLENADIVAKAHKRANLILRAFVSRDINTLVRACLAYVRPSVGFNSIVWSPYIVKDSGC